jgi:hypothetical protein
LTANLPVLATRQTAVKIDSTSPEHAYQQLAAQLREQIARGKITAKLPSLAELTAQTHLATGTVRRAIDVLAREHLVQTVPGPRHIRDRRRTPSALTATGTPPAQRDNGHDPGTYAVQVSAAASRSRVKTSRIGWISADATAISHATTSSPAATLNTSHAITAACPRSAARAVTARRTRTLSRPRRTSDSTSASLTTGLTCAARRCSKSPATIPQARCPPAYETSIRTRKRRRARRAIMTASIPGSGHATPRRPPTVPGAAR